MNTVVGNISQNVIAKLLTIVSEEDPLPVPVQKAFIRGRLDIILSRLKLGRGEVRIPLHGKITGDRDMVLTNIKQVGGVLWFTPKSEGGAFDRVVNQAMRMAIKIIHKKLQVKVTDNRKRRATRRSSRTRHARPKPVAAPASPPLDEGIMRFAQEQVHVDGDSVGIGIASLLADWDWLEITEIRVDNDVKFTLTTKRPPDLSFQPGNTMSANLQISSSFLQSILSDARIIPDTTIEDTPIGAIEIQGSKVRIDGSALIVPVKLGGEQFALRVLISDGKISADLLES